ncbi:hypothetical protein WA026_012447, partial [Henosepilachna vigintioctopunctata]
IREEEFECKVLPGKNGTNPVIAHFKKKWKPDINSYTLKKDLLNLKYCNIEGKKGNVLFHEDLSKET